MIRLLVIHQNLVALVTVRPDRVREGVIVVYGILDFVDDDFDLFDTYFSEAIFSEVFAADSPVRSLVFRFPVSSGIAGGEPLALFRLFEDIFYSIEFYEDSS